MNANCPNCGWESEAEQLQRHTGAFPYGLQSKEGHPHEVEKNYEEIATIDTICHRWRQGDGLRAIARWLNHTGVRTRKGTDWQATQIRRILRRAGLI